MSGRDHSVECAVCGEWRGGMNDLECECEHNNAMNFADHVVECGISDDADPRIALLAKALVKQRTLNERLQGALFVAEAVRDDARAASARDLELRREALAQCKQLKRERQMFKEQSFPMRTMRLAAVAGSGTCRACGHSHVFHDVGRGDGVPVGVEYCDDRHSDPCDCKGFVP